MRLSDASNMFLELKGQEGFSPYTIHAYRLQHTLLIRDIGDLDVTEVTLQLLRTHLSHHNHLKPASLGHKIRAIKSLFHWLVEDSPRTDICEGKRLRFLAAYVSLV